MAWRPDNRTEALGNYFKLEHSLKLCMLDAFHNKLSDLDTASLPNSVEIILLKYNKLRLIQPFTFFGKKFSRVDLTTNYFIYLEVNTFRLSEVPFRRFLPEYSITNNSYLCDCHMKWLQAPTDLWMELHVSFRVYNVSRPSERTLNNYH